MCYSCAQPLGPGVMTLSNQDHSGILFRSGRWLVPKLMTSIADVNRRLLVPGQPAPAGSVASRSAQVSIQPIR